MNVDSKAEVDPWYKAKIRHLVQHRLHSAELPALLIGTSAASWFIFYALQRAFNSFDTVNRFWIFVLGVIVLVVLTLLASGIWRQRICAYKVFIREQLSRQFTEDRQILTDTETVPWLNHLLSRIWSMHEETLSDALRSGINAGLEAYRPSFIESISITEFAIGSCSPQIVAIKSYPGTANDLIRFDVELLFQPVDTDDPLYTDTKKSLFKDNGGVNSRIALTTRVGLFGRSVRVPIVAVHDVAFSGVMSVQVKTMTTFPFIDKASLCFARSPDVQFKLQPMNVPGDLISLLGLSHLLEGVNRDIFSAILVEPNALTLDVNGLLNGQGNIESAAGVLVVKILDARGLESSSVTLSPEELNIYSQIKVGGRSMGQTHVIRGTWTPFWNENFDLIVNSLNDEFELHVCNKSGNTDVTLGIYRAVLKQLGLHKRTKTGVLVRPLKINKNKSITKQPLVKHVQTKQEANVTAENKGEIIFELSYYPCVDLALSSCVSAVLRLTIHEARDLESNSITGVCSSYVELQHGSQLFHTEVKRQTNAPKWEETFQVLVRDMRQGAVRFSVYDSSEGATIGELHIDVQKIVRQSQSPASFVNESMNWWALDGVPSGSLRLSFQLRPIKLESAID